MDFPPPFPDGSAAVEHSDGLHSDLDNGCFLRSTLDEESRTYRPDIEYVHLHGNTDDVGGYVQNSSELFAGPEIASGYSPSIATDFSGMLPGVSDQAEQGVADNYKLQP